MTEDALYRPELWSLAPDVLHLNHGSFGACPSQIIEEQTPVASANGIQHVAIF